jgi:hypothetical protein
MSSKLSNNAKSAVKNVIFNALAVAVRLESLRKAAVDAGREDSQWWKAALEFEWASPRKGNNGTQWVSVNYTDENGTKSRLVVRINGERQTGRIMPNTDAGVAELIAELKNPNVQIKKRDKKPSIQIQKWSAQVKTAEDGVTVLTDEGGNLILPGDDKLSAYFRCASLVGEAFAAEATERVEKGAALVTKVVEMKKKDRVVTAAAVVTAFNDEHGPRKPGDMVLSSEGISVIRKAFPAKKDEDLLTKGATVTTKVSIAHLIQERIGNSAAKNGGMPLPNPMTRFALNFAPDTGLAQVSFFDKNKPFSEEGRQKFEAAKVGNEPVNADNVHKFILSRSGLDGIVNMDSVCFSSMGISMPVKAEVLVVTQPSSREMSLDDVYGDDGAAFSLADAIGSPATPAAPAPATAAAPVPTTAAAPVPTTTAAPASPAGKGSPPPAAEAAYDDDLIAELAGEPPKVAARESVGV